MARTAALVTKTALPRTTTGSGPEGSTQSFKRGAFLVWSSGTLVEASANPRNIVGIALNDATGTTGATVIFVKALPHGLIQIEMSLDKASATGTVDLAATDRGVAYGITLASGVWYLDIDKVTAGTNTAVVVDELVGAIGSDSINTVPTDADPKPGRVLVSLLSEAVVTHQAAS